MEGVAAGKLTDAERFEQAYAFAARHLATEFHTAAVLTHDKLRTFAARGLICMGISGGPSDIDHVVALVEQRGLKIRGEHAALIIGMIDDKLKVTNTAQVRIEETLAARARRAASDRSGALSSAALQAATDASGLDFDREQGTARRRRR